MRLLEKHSSKSLEERLRRIAAGDGMNRNVYSQIGLVGAAAMHDLHVIQGPNYARGGNKKAFFAFHTFVVEDSIIEKNRVRAKL